MKSTTVAIVAVLVLSVFRLDTQVFISADVLTARDVKRAVCPVCSAAEATTTCDAETNHLENDRCSWLKAQDKCMRAIYNACVDVNINMAMQVENLLVFDSLHAQEC